ncbi:PREDICTED: uncharacterized protein LOC109206840 [Nicotiana attenuata]|uniref:uncharacterized protein LOC109206840 n=1 Tax=Nicotiana attenuata TaxID=49451 RepID=UPI00090497A9|nr:PREDICTED: uncharacterized protein LOC109206840 [Nicotiana attenuata]
MAPKAPKDPNAPKKGKAPKAPRLPVIPQGPYILSAPPTKPGQRYYEFGDWLNSKCYWKGNHDLKKLIATFLTPTQQDKLNNGTFRYIMAMENFKCIMKLVHCLCLSRIFTNDRDSISFKIFGHDASFTLKDFHIMCGLRITTHNVERPINRESNLLKRYFGKSKGVTLKDIRSFMTRNEIPKNVVNHVHVCESDDDAVKLMEIIVVESILFGKNTELCVAEEYASIVEDDKVCAEYPWGNVAYEKLIYALKHALYKQNKFHTTEYKLGGFPYPLCAWFYERFPDVREKYIREDENLDNSQVPRMLRYRYRDFRVMDIIPTEEELNSMPLIGKLSCSRIRSNVVNAVPSTGESPRTLNRIELLSLRLTTEVQRHAEKERSTIVNGVFDKFKKEERTAIVDTVFVKVKFEVLFTIVNKSNGMGDGNFDLSKHREYDRMNDCYEHPSAFEGDQHVQEEFEERRSTADRLSRDVNDEAHLSTENIGSKQGADNQVVETEEHTAHDALCKVADDNATHNEAAVEGVEHVQQHGGEEQSSVCRQSKGGKKGADDQVVGTEKHAPSCALESDIGKGALAICKELVGGDTHEIVTTVEVETSCSSTQKLSNDAQLNEGRVEKNLPENTAMVIAVDM